MEMGITISRFGVWLVSLDPTQGSEIQKIRPCLIIPPDEMNHYINTIIIAPMTTTLKEYPTRVNIYFQGKHGQIVLDQIRTVDKSRLITHLGKIPTSTAKKVLNVLQEMFHP